MGNDISIKDIMDKFQALEKEIQDLKRDKAQAEGLCAAVMKRVGRIEDFTFTDLFKSDFSKVRFYPLEENSSRTTVIYVED